MGFLQIFPNKKLPVDKKSSGETNLLQKVLFLEYSFYTWPLPQTISKNARIVRRVLLALEDHNFLCYLENRSMQDRGVQASHVALPTCLSPDLQAFKAGFIPCAHSALGLSYWCQKMRAMRAKWDDSFCTVLFGPHETGQWDSNKDALLSHWAWIHSKPPAAITESSTFLLI